MKFPAKNVILIGKLEKNDYKKIFIYTCVCTKMFNDFVINLYTVCCCVFFKKEEGGNLPGKGIVRLL